ncbi:MAG: hypothetical protein CMP11_00605 [Zetaproteobacteria bacterium]|nr:hypothetical protein [Pseudobdellovibrionaceae bacterium]
MKQISHFFYFVFFFVFFSCGQDTDTNGSKTAVISSPTELIFKKAAENTNLPVRLLLATSFLESKMQAQRAYSLKGNKRSFLPNGETAFGLTRKTLGLEEFSDAGDLVIQVKAYTKWLKNSLIHSSLPEKPEKFEDTIYWIWEIAKLHRSSSGSRNNERIIFTKELVKILNEGFYWYDSYANNFVEFPKETNPIDLQNKNLAFGSMLNLDYRRAQVESAVYLPLASPVSLAQKQKPVGIEILHCPFELSSCLALQSQTMEGSYNTGLYAHYIIPQSPAIIDRSLQVHTHDSALPKLTVEGEQGVSNKLRILLVGYSGSYSESKRRHAQGDWLTPWQTKRLGELVHDLCVVLTKKVSAEDQDLAMRNCKEIGQGVTVYKPERTVPFQWGVISDYNKEFFMASLSEDLAYKDTLQVRMKTEKDFYQGGEDLEFKLSFHPNAESLEVEKLVRCPTGKVLWDRIQTKNLRNTRTAMVYRREWGGGPNFTGAHFFRFKIYDTKGDLMAWQNQKINIRDFEKTRKGPYPSLCSMEE